MYTVFSSANLIEAVKYAVATPVILVVIGLIIHFIDSFLTNLIAKVTNATIAFFIRNYLTYPGTVHHELSHALLILLTGAKLIRINLLPRGNTLGSVDFQTRGNFILKSMQLSLSALAPVICGTTSLCLMIYAVWPNCNTAWHYLLFFYIFISIFFHMTMSTQDILNFLKGFPICLLILFIIFLFVRPDIASILSRFQPFSAVNRVSFMNLK